MSKHSFNYSGIVSARRCNKLFQYLYIDKLKSDSPLSGDMQFGTGIHLGVETFLEGDDGVKAFDMFWDIERTRKNAYGRFGWDDLKTQAHIMLDRFKRLHLKKFEIYQMEQRLYGELSGVKIEGTPDFIGKFEGVETVLDFKTAGYRYPKDKMVIAEQLYLYDELVRQRFSYKSQQLVYFVFIKGREPSIQILKHNYSQEAARVVLDDFSEYCKQLQGHIDNKHFVRNRSNCLVGENRCEFWSKCHLSKEEEKDE